MSITIRPFTKEDYESANAIRVATRPDYPDTAEVWRAMDAKRDPMYRMERWIAEKEGRPVGYACYEQMPWMFHPRKFMFDISVHPDAQRRGVGGALYSHMLEAMRPEDPLSIRTMAREDESASRRFLESRGFREIDRAWESRLNVDTFDMEPYADEEEKVRAGGIEIHTYRELENTPDHLQKLWVMDMEASKDIPAPPDQPLNPIPYETYIRWFDEKTGLLKDGYFIATDGERYVGVSALWHHDGSDDLYTGFTGVLPDYRRRGIALALKLRAVQYAKDRGVHVIRTDNNARNRPMLSINERLGFQKMPAWLEYLNQLGE